jgi:hypothetical protein
VPPPRGADALAVQVGVGLPGHAMSTRTLWSRSAVVMAMTAPLVRWRGIGGRQRLARPAVLAMLSGMWAAEVIAAFAAAWNTADDAERLELLAGCCRPDAVFAAPQGKVTGIEVMSASIGEFRRAFPAAEVAFGVPDGYRDFARVSWVTRWHDGRADLAGEDFAQFGADGRIQLLVSFDGNAALPCG